LPSLENLHQEFKDKNFTLLAVDVGEKEETVQRFVHDQGLSFRFLLDEDGQVSAQYGIRSHPMKFLIDKKGNVAGIAQGYREWDKEEMKSLIKLLMIS
jgi:peroxiredoxin